MSSSSTVEGGPVPLFPNGIPEGVSVYLNVTEAGDTFHVEHVGGARLVLPPGVLVSRLRSAVQFVASTAPVARAPRPRPQASRARRPRATGSSNSRGDPPDSEGDLSQSRASPQAGTGGALDSGCAACGDTGLVVAPFRIALTEDGHTYTEWASPCNQCDEGRLRAKHLREGRWTP